MKNKITFLCFLFASCALYSQPDLSSSVDPFIGTGGHGHTYPGATLPFGMVQLSPDTRIDGSWDGCSGYHYSDSVIYGFSHTHLSGTGCTDYGDILLMPFSGTAAKVSSKPSTFSHTNEKASPGFYSVYLDDNKVKAELTTTLRAGFHRYIFEKGKPENVLVDLAHRDEVLESQIIVIDKYHVQGFRRSKAWAADQVVYFYLEFSHPMEDFICNGQTLTEKNLKLNVTYSGKDLKTIFSFSNRSDTLLVKVGISSVSWDGAKRNLKAEIADWNFDKVKADARRKWNKELGKIEASGGTTEQTKIFYTALYHCMVVPNIFDDVDGQYRGRDKLVHQAIGNHIYTVFSLWDTFRAWNPLMTIIDQKRTLDYVKTFLAQYDQGGLLPVWELWGNETECMIGYHAVPVIVDAAVKGIQTFDMVKALKAMRKSAESRDRYGLGSYMDQGYLDVLDEAESVSKTLEYAYDDWCIARFSSLLKDKASYTTYMKRSQYWKNLYDRETGFMRPRYNGGWLTPFDPFQVNNNFTEANSWQYSFFVPQDVNGLMEISGGKEKFERKLDSLFTANPKTTGREQADITGLIGQYAHGNEPSHHMAYLYNYVDRPHKTQYRIHQILTEQYRAQPDGLAGNEDCGQMSAWYVMSAMGIYCVTPGSGYYTFGTPVFPKVKIHLENGKTYTIAADNVSDKNFYVRSAKLNGKPYSRLSLAHRELMNGGTLSFEMTDRDDKVEMMKGMQSAKADTSLLIVADPVIKVPSRIFNDSMIVSLESNDDALIYYTTKGETPTEHSMRYKTPFMIHDDIILKAIAVKGLRESFVTTSSLLRNKHSDWKIKISSHYNAQYTAGGDAGIIDGITADVKWQKGGWQGYQAQDFEAVVDLGKEQSVHSLYADFLQDTRAWIIYPTKVEFETSTDNIHFTKVVTAANAVPANDYNAQVQLLGAVVQPINARYIKVKAYNFGKLPDWHLGAGGEAYIFIDEFKIE